MISEPYCQSGATKSRDQTVLNTCMLLFPFLAGDKREEKKKKERESRNYLWSNAKPVKFAHLS